MGRPHWSCRSLGSKRLQVGILPSALAGRSRVDFRRVTFCDSTVVDVLLAADRTTRGMGGELAVANPSPLFLRVLTALGLDGRLNVVATSLYV